MLALSIQYCIMFTQTREIGYPRGWGNPPSTVNDNHSHYHSYSENNLKKRLTRSQEQAIITTQQKKIIQILRDKISLRGRGINGKTQPRRQMIKILIRNCKRESFALENYYHSHLQMRINRIRNCKQESFSNSFSMKPSIDPSKIQRSISTEQSISFYQKSILPVLYPLLLTCTTT